MKKRLVIMSLLVLSLGTVSASRVKSLSQPAAPKDENKKEQMAKPVEMKMEKPAKPVKPAKVKMAKPAKPAKMKMAKPGKMKKEKVAKVKMAKPVKMKKDKPVKVKKEKVVKHKEQEQMGHDIPSLVAHRNELMMDVNATKSEIHEKLEDANCINYDMNLAARKKYRADKKHMNDQINELRLEARKSGSEHREKDQKDLHTTIENLQGFGMRPEAQADHDALPALREELESLRKDQRDTINKLKAQCKREHVRYEPAKRVKVKKMKMVQEPKVKMAKPAKMKKVKADKPSKMKMAKPAKVKMAKSAKPAKMKMEKPAKAKKAKMAKPAKAVKPVMAKPAKVKKAKKSAHFRMYSHEKIQEKSEDAMNNAGSSKRKRFSSSKEEDGSMSLEKPVKKEAKPAAAAKMQKPVNKMKNADEIMEMGMQK